MGEALPKPKPVNDNDDVVVLQIRSGVNGMSGRFTETNPDQDIEAVSDYEVTTFDIDPTSPENLQEIKEHIKSLGDQLVAISSMEREEVVSDVEQQIMEHLRRQISDLYDLLRFQNEDLFSGAGESQINQRAARIGEAFGTFLSDYDQFVDAFNEGDVIALEEQAARVGVSNGQEVETEKKKGWWNKDRQEAAGVSVAGANGELKQVWGDQDGPIGFVPPEAEHDEDRERTGWWQTHFKEEQGFKGRDMAAELTQKGDTTSLYKNEVVEPLPTRVTAYPLPGGKKRIMMSHQNPEELFPESDKPELTAERIEEYRKWVEAPDTQEAPLAFEIVTDADIPNVDSLVNVTPPLQGEVLPPEVDPLYAHTRAEWRETGQAHLEAHKAYREALTDYYAALQEQSFGKKLWTRTKASFGFKPELPEEIVAMRDDMFAKTEAYNALAKKMVEQRVRGGKEQASEKVLERYRSMLARTLLLNTFDEQLSAQKKATEDLAFGQSEFMKKHGKAIRITGAAAIGGLTGGVFGVGSAIARTFVGAAVTGTAVGAVGEWQDRRVDEISNETAEKRAMEIGTIETMLKRGGLSKEELEESYQYLSKIYHEVDKATQIRIAAILGTVLVSTVLVADVSSSVAETAVAQSGGVVPAEGIGSVADTAADNDSIVIDVSAGPEGSSVGDSTQGEVGSTEGATSSYEAKLDDNLWDIMEGQAAAGELPYLDHVPEAEQQRIIALVAERLNEDATLRADVGFGDTADDLAVGAEVDIAKLNEIAEEIARAEGVYMEVTPEALDTSSAEVADASVEANTGVEASAATANETVSVRTVSPNETIDYARTYPGGYVKFEQDFEKLFVERIQGPTPATGGLLNFIFGGAPNTADAYKLFSPYTIAEFNELANTNQTALAEALAQDGIDINDYRAWREELSQWQAAGLAVRPEDDFGEVARAAFINSLSQPKAA